MRRTILSLLVAVIVASCNWPVTSTSSGTGTGGGDAGSSCPQTSTCAACTLCAQNGPCSTLQSACDANSQCLAIDQCYGICGSDASCRQQCVSASPGGVSDYGALLTCIN